MLAGLASRQSRVASQNITATHTRNASTHTVTVVSTASGATLPANTTVSAITTAAVPPSQGTVNSGAGGSVGTPGTIQLSAAPTAAPNLYLPVQLYFALTGNSVTGGTDNNAVFTGAALNYSATIQVERSFDGGSTWIVANIGGGGTVASYSTGTPVSVTFGEPESQVLYRLNCVAYSSGTINYRISTTGAASLSLAINQLS